MASVQVEKWQLALLKDLRDYLNVCYWNKNQKEMASPFDNTGNTFKTKNLEIKAYNWDEDEGNDYNLKYGDIEISWYKYLGRGTTINKCLTHIGWVSFYESAREEIKKYFGKFAPDK